MEEKIFKLEVVFDDETDGISIQTTSQGLSFWEAIGLLEMAKQQILDENMNSDAIHKSSHDVSEEEEDVH